MALHGALTSTKAEKSPDLSPSNNCISLLLPYRFAITLAAQWRYLKVFLRYCKLTAAREKDNILLNNMLKTGFVFIGCAKPRSTRVDVDGYFLANYHPHLLSEGDKAI